MDKFDKFTLGVFVSAIIMATIIFCTSCNPYKKITKRPPLTVTDSSNLSKVSGRVFPQKKAVVKPGKTIVVQKRDSIAHYKRITDSLKGLPKQVIRLQDSCGKEANEAYNKGFELGYEVGRYDTKSNCPPNTERVDSFFRPTPEDAVILADTQNKLSAAEKQALKDKATISTQASKSKNKTILILSLIIALILSGIGNFFQFKKNKFFK